MKIYQIVFLSTLLMVLCWSLSNLFYLAIKMFRTDTAFSIFIMLLIMGAILFIIESFVIEGLDTSKSLCFFDIYRNTHRNSH